MPSPGGGVQHRIYDLFASCVSSPPPLNFQALDIHACMHSLGLRFAFQFLSFCRLPLFNLTSKSPVISKLSQKNGDWNSGTGMEASWGPEPGAGNSADIILPMCCRAWGGLLGHCAGLDPAGSPTAHGGPSLESTRCPSAGDRISAQ